MNTNSTLRDFVHTESFVPFEIELATGRVFRVDHPDFIFVPAARFDKHQPYFTVYSKTGAPHSANPVLVVRISPRASRSSRR